MWYGDVAWKDPHAGSAAPEMRMCGHMFLKDADEHQEKVKQLQEQYKELPQRMWFGTVEPQNVLMDHWDNNREER